MVNRALGLAAFAAAAAGGAALGFVGERKVVRSGARDIDQTPSALDDPCRGEPVDVTSPDGTRIAAQVSGPADGPPVLLVHGMGLGQEVWHYQRQALQGDHRVVTYDLRGHGDSGLAVDNDYSAGALADDVVAVLQTVVGDDRRAVLVGHSLGGMSVLAGLRYHPEVLRYCAAGIGLVASAGSDVVGGLLRTASAAGVTIVQSAIIRSSPAHWIRNRLDAPRGARANDMSFLLTRFFGLSPEALPDVVEFVDRLNRRVPATVLGSFAQTLTTIDELDYLDAVDVPATVVVGEDDRLTPPAQAEKLVERLRDVEFVRIAGAGHTVMVEQPDEVTKAIRRLVERANEE